MPDARQLAEGEAQRLAVELGHHGGGEVPAPLAFTGVVGLPPGVPLRPGFGEQDSMILRVAATPGPA